MNNNGQDQFNKVREDIRLMLRNRFTYPKTIVEVAQTRPLTKEEVKKVEQCLTDALEIVNSELIILFIKIRG